MQRWHGRAPVPDAYGRVNGHLGLPLGYVCGLTHGLSWALVVALLGCLETTLGFLLDFAKGVVARIGTILKAIFGVKTLHVTEEAGDFNSSSNSPIPSGSSDLCLKMQYRSLFWFCCPYDCFFL